MHISSSSLSKKHHKLKKSVQSKQQNKIISDNIADSNEEYFTSTNKKIRPHRISKQENIEKSQINQVGIYKKMEEKLSDIQSQIQQIKANIYKKKLQRQKRTIQRNIQLSNLKKINNVGFTLNINKDTMNQIFSSQQQMKFRKGQQISKNEINKFDRQQKSSQAQPKQIGSKNKANNPLSQFVTQIKQDHPMQQNQQNISNMMQQTLNGMVTHFPESNSKIFVQNPYGAKSIYYVSQIIKGYQDKKSIMWEHIKTSIYLFNYFANVRMPSNIEVSKRMLNLTVEPGYENKKTVIFDLDQTLIHCNQNLAMGHQVQLPVTFPNGDTIYAGINIRPGAMKILQSLHQKFQLIVFTASHKCYANVVVDYLDPQKKFIHHRLYRQHCYVTPKGEYVKDLRIINRELKNMVLIDNAAYSYAFQAENGIPILPYFTGQTDFELEMLENYLISIANCADVRIQNRKTFKLNKYRDYKANQVEQLVENLYINV